MQCSVEQRMAIEFTVKYWETASETVPMVKTAFANDCLSDRSRCSLPKFNAKFNRHVFLDEALYF